MSLPGNLAVPSPAVADLGERALIARIRERLAPPPASVVVGIGDDAAVVTPERGALDVLTTDALVEGVHFDWRFSSPFDVGYKALAVNVSDIASMGGAPHHALLSLLLPAATSLSRLDELIDGVTAAAAAYKVAVVGGNITRSPGPLCVDVTVTGTVRPRRMLTRGGGRPGDLLYVTGTVGAGVAGFEWLRGAGSAGVPGEMDACVQRYRRPEARARVGALLGRNRAARACMDLSDGLADGVTQMAAASSTGARLDAAAIPVDDGARMWFQSQDRDPVMAALAGGDDYELLFAVPPKWRGRLRSVERESRGVSFTRIGELTADPAVTVVRDGRIEPLPPGFAHF